jgi:hypothetical protein
MALVGPVFFDTSVLLAGLIELGPGSEPAQAILDAITERQLGRVHTAWHCCPEFYAVSTRLPVEFRLIPPTPYGSWRRKSSPGLKSISSRKTTGHIFCARWATSA